MENLVFIPGLLGDKTFWQPTIDAMGDAYRVRIVDVSRGRSLDELALEVADQITESSIVIGFSFGAWIATLAYQHLGQKCEGLVLVSSAPGALKESTRRHFIGSVEKIRSGNFGLFLTDDFEDDVATINQTKELRTSFLMMAQRQGPEVGIKQLEMMINFEGDLSSLSHIQCKTLLVRGTEDKSINRARQDEIAREVSHAKLVEISDAAHYVPLERPGSLAGALREFVRSIKTR